jgi:hypothetical protein
VEQIEKTCADLLAHFHYPCSISNSMPPAYATHMRRLKFFEHVYGLQGIPTPQRAEVDCSEASAAVLAFVGALDARLLERSRLPEHELRLLKASIREYMNGLASDMGTIFDLALPMASSDADAALLRLPQRLLGRARRILGVKS